MSEWRRRGNSTVAVSSMVVMLAMAASASAQPAALGHADQASGPRITIPRLESPPRMTDFEDMTPHGPGLIMVKVTGLIDRLPRDGVSMSEPTEVYLGYDDEAIYAVFACFDREPSQIRAHLNGRDRVPESEDSVALQLDTFRDRQHAYGFQTNALGVQQDGIWTEGKGWDLSFDTVWRTESRRTSQGYVVMLSVPFKSLRFPAAAAQEWGVLLFRGIARRNEEGFWPAYSTRIAGRMNQAGILAGLERVSPGGTGQLVPYVSTRSFRAVEIDRQRGHMVSDAMQPRIGADAKLIVRDSVTIDLTANPDFSQVESDEPQVTVNRRFETFFPEKRPFFLENASYFDTPIPLLFTRRIAEPDGGARVTGRLGRYAFGALAGKDRADDRAAGIGVVRINRDLGTQSTLGIFASTREQAGASNRVGGVDARLKAGANWFVTLQALTSATRDPDGRRRDGSAYRATVLRSSRHLTYNADFNDRSQGFHTALGFIERTDVRSLDQTLSYRWMPAASRLLSWGPDLTVSEVRDHDNRALDRTLAPKLSFEWPGLTKLSLVHQDARVRLRRQEVASALDRSAFAQDQTAAEFTTSFVRQLTLTLKAAAGDGINLAPVAGARPANTRSRDVSIVSEVRPGVRLNVGASYLMTRLVTPAGARIFTNQIVRGKINYQFTRTLAARMIVQYDGLSTSPLHTALERRRNVNLDVLVTYLRTPGTALYIGFNDNHQNLDPALTVGPSGLRRTSGGLLNDGRQFFVKASYLLRK